MTSIAGRLLYPPASTKELRDLVALSASSSADGDRHQREFGIARIRLAPASNRLVQAALAFATWLEIASIKAGYRQS